MPKPIRKKRSRGRGMNFFIPDYLVTNLEDISRETGLAVETHVLHALVIYLRAKNEEIERKRINEAYLEYLSKKKLVKPEFPPKPIRQDEKLRPNEPRARRRTPRKPN